MTFKYDFDFRASKESYYYTELKIYSVYVIKRLLEKENRSKEKKFSQETVTSTVYFTYLSLIIRYLELLKRTSYKNITFEPLTRTLISTIMCLRIEVYLTGKGRKTL